MWVCVQCCELHLFDLVLYVYHPDVHRQPSASLLGLRFGHLLPPPCWSIVCCPEFSLCQGTNFAGIYQLLRSSRSASAQWTHEHGKHCCTGLNPKRRCPQRREAAPFPTVLVIFVSPASSRVACQPQVGDLAPWMLLCTAASVCSPLWKRAEGGGSSSRLMPFWEWPSDFQPGQRELLSCPQGRRRYDTALMERRESRGGISLTVDWRLFSTLCSYWSGA